MTQARWRVLSTLQDGMIARRQLRNLGVDADYVRNQFRAGRWAPRSDQVVSTFTGPLLWRHYLWLGTLHAGGSATVGGLSAAKVHGLKNWERDEVTVLVDDHRAFDPVRGVRFVQTRRPLIRYRMPGQHLPVCRIEPAILLFAAYACDPRTAQGVLAATVQQRLTTPTLLLNSVNAMRPLRRARVLREVITDIAGGVESLAERDVTRLCETFGLPRPVRQRQRRDATGRKRFTDCEWDLPDGRVLVLEVDGSFHMTVEHWEEDIARQRALSAQNRIIVRCTARELRDRPGIVAADLRRLGLGAPVLPLG